MRKKGFTFEQHQRLGIDLYKIHRKLQILALHIGHEYPRPIANIADAAEDKVGKLRCKLDDLVCAENRALPDQSVTTVYYGVHRRHSEIEADLQSSLSYLRQNRRHTEVFNADKKNCS